MRHNGNTRTAYVMEYDTARTISVKVVSSRTARSFDSPGFCDLASEASEESMRSHVFIPTKG